MLNTKVRVFIDEAEIAKILHRQIVFVFVFTYAPLRQGNESYDLSRQPYDQINQLEQNTSQH